MREYTMSMSEPEQGDAGMARAALAQVRRSLTGTNDRAEPISIRVEGESEVITIPRAAVELLVRILGGMAAGRSVTVVPARAELTTQQAADLLNVSRPYLIGLLDAGEIEYRMVGTHRRVRMESLMSYKRRDDAKRRTAADELTSLSQDVGLT